MENEKPLTALRRTWAIDPVLSAIEDCDARLADGDVAAADLCDRPGACRADESLINAMGTSWVLHEAVGYDGEETSEAWEEHGLAWCEAYADAYNVHALLLAESDRRDQ